ncbi:MAG: hypothetical protein ISR65_14040 [Bacteriovoracaceae bacterium]|nr:hypothetical protein [Bacteriovoracaceae bacterium]
MQLSTKKLSGKCKQFIRPFNDRRKFMHFMAVFVCLLISVPNKAFCINLKKIDRITALKLLNPLNKRSSIRGPANFTPDADLETVPLITDNLVQQLDDSREDPLLKEIKKQLATWKEQDDYVRNWNQSGNGLIKLPTLNQRRRYLEKQFIKFLDQRLTKRVDKAKPGSAISRIGQIEKSLKPNTKITFTKNVKMRMKFKILQGSAMAQIISPYVKCTIDTSLKSKKLNVNLTNELKSLGLGTKIDLDTGTGRYVASVNKVLAYNVNTNIYSAQKHNSLIFSKESDTGVAFTYAMTF